ncbi:hypothetical protein CP533_2460 [Ophiocordyceps camponoti-saundersi (nom. inval.)]|nr:hypothetical protein CP533_2460 [Ophiocordyceps camponoti-saundersi (nom. inval.)]
MSLRTILLREIDLFVGFSWRDWMNAVISTWLFSLGGFKDVSSISEGVVNNLVVIVWVTCCMYSFNLFTQSRSLDEDLLNKPDRPIPSGKISVEEAFRRFLVIWLALAAVCVFHPQIITATVLWFLLTLLLGATKSGGHWFWKNTIAMSLGTWAFFSAGHKLMVPAKAEPPQHAAMMAVWAGLTAHVQDFRDQKGDRKVGRRTIPLSYGDGPARIIVATLLFPAAFAVLYKLDFVRNAPLLLCCVHAWLSYRILACRGKDSDTSTYTIYGFIFCTMALISSLDRLDILSNTFPSPTKSKMVRSVILLIGLPVLAYCSTIPNINATEASGNFKRGSECRTYQDCPPCGFYERCCLPSFGGGWCECGTSGRENTCK